MSREMDVIKGVVEKAIEDLGNNAQQFRAQIDHFLTSIEGDVTKAIAAGDTRTLKYLRDATAGRLTRTSLGLLHQQRQVILATVMAAVRTLIDIAL